MAYGVRSGKECLDRKEDRSDLQRRRPPICAIKKGTAQKPPESADDGPFGVVPLRMSKQIRPSLSMFGW